MTRAEALIAAVRAKGSDARDLRDAAHEAHHALTAGAKRWTRSSIDRAIKRKVKRIGDRVNEEILARAVEQIVCTELGVKCESVEVCANTACLEAAYYGDPFLSCEQAVIAIRNRMESDEARAAADRVLALGDES